MIQEAEADGLHASTVNTWICDVQISMGISCFFWAIGLAAIEVCPSPMWLGLIGQKDLLNPSQFCREEHGIAACSNRILQQNCPRLAAAEHGFIEEVASLQSIFLECQESPWRWALHSFSPWIGVPIVQTCHVPLAQWMILNAGHGRPGSDRIMYIHLNIWMY